MIISSLCTHILSQDDEYGLDIIAQQLKSKNRVRTHILEENSRMPRPHEIAICQPEESSEPSKGKRIINLADSAPTNGTRLRSTQGCISRRPRTALWLDTPGRLPAKCACGAVFSVEHALSCPKGGFPSIRHNEIRNLTATLN